MRRDVGNQVTSASVPPGEQGANHHQRQGDQTHAARQMEQPKQDGGDESPQGKAVADRHGAENVAAEKSFLGDWRGESGGDGKERERERRGMVNRLQLLLLPIHRESY